VSFRPKVDAPRVNVAPQPPPGGLPLDPRRPAGSNTHGNGTSVGGSWIDSNSATSASLANSEAAQSEEGRSDGSHKASTRFSPEAGLPFAPPTTPPRKAMASVGRRSTSCLSLLEKRSSVGRRDIPAVCLFSRRGLQLVEETSVSRARPPQGGSERDGSGSPSGTGCDSSKGSGNEAGARPGPDALNPDCSSSPITSGKFLRVH